MEASIYKMEKCGKKRKFMFSAAAEKNSIYILYILVFPPCGVTGVGMDGLKAQPARSLPLPR